MIVNNTAFARSSIGSTYKRSYKHLYELHASLRHFIAIQSVSAIDIFCFRLIKFAFAHVRNEFELSDNKSFSYRTDNNRDSRTNQLSAISILQFSLLQFCFHQLKKKLRLLRHDLTCNAEIVQFSVSQLFSQSFSPASANYALCLLHHLLIH